MIVKRLFTGFFLAIAAALLLFIADHLINQGQVMKGLLQSVLSDKSLQSVDLATLRRSTSNSYLVADTDQTTAKTNTGALHLTLEGASGQIRVREAIRSILVSDLRAVERDVGGSMLLFVDRTPMVGFPDGLYAWVDEVASAVGSDGDQISVRVALFSRSVYGRRDFGVNQKRVQYVIQELTKRFSD